MKCNYVVWVGLVIMCTSVWGQTQYQAEKNKDGFVGVNVCGSCHKEQFKLWQGSHHDLAMQHANEKSVLGDFNDAVFTYNGIKSRFYKKGNKFFVHTDGEDGKLNDYEISFTFGFDPLQQYLIEMSGGRLQTLTIAWDSRSKKQGGQRWFHLYPDSKHTYRDTLHWTGIDLNWNYMCAECHSTNLQKKYNATTDQYETTWSEINVACEACHGPGQKHLKWAGDGKNKAKNTQKGLLVSLKDSSVAQWHIDTKTGNAKPQPRGSYSNQIETCARCHSRRSILREDYVYGRAIGDSHRVSLLEENLYYADGQIKDEVYVYGSFLQSNMYADGVNCNDCHNPHSLKLHNTGNQLCLRCHGDEKYNNKKHHHHKEKSTGSMCVECHMPETNYMIVDPRRDHSMRVPRPDLSDQYATPNACIACHKKRSNKWAAGYFKKWYAGKIDGLPPGLEAFHAARTDQLNAEKLLLEAANDKVTPGIIRATAVHEMAQNLSSRSLQNIVSMLHDKDPLVRAASISAIDVLPPKQRLELGYNLLMDENKMVRLAAAQSLAIMPADLLSAEQATVLKQAVKEYFAAQQINADRPEAQMNMGLMFVGFGDFQRAESAYQAALKLQPTFVQAYINLADLYRGQNRDDDAEKILHKALSVETNNPHAHHAMGLLQVRKKQMQSALLSLQKAYELLPDSGRYAYVYSVALNSTGNSKQALAVLKKAHMLHANNREILTALVSFNQELGNNKQALKYAKQLLSINPQDPSVNNLVEQLKSKI